MSLLFTVAVADREKCPGDRARYQKAEGARRADAAFKGGASHPSKLGLIAMEIRR